MELNKKNLFVSIVICTHNRKNSLEKYIFKSIPKLNYSNYEVIIVDDASTDGTKEFVAKYRDKIKNLNYIKNRKQRSLSYARNLGVKYSNGEIIAFTDDDCYINKNWLNELVKPYLGDKDIMVVGGKSYIKAPDKKFTPAGRIYGCNMSFRKEIFKKFLFDTWLYFNKSSVGDETDLIWRIQDKNFKVIYTDKVVISHFIEPANYRQKAGIGSPLNNIYIHTKKMSKLDFFSDFINYIILAKSKKKRNDLSPSYLSYSFCFNKLATILSNARKKSLLSSCRLYLRLLPILLFEIPLKAKIKHFLEERKFKNDIV